MNLRVTPHPGETTAHLLFRFGWQVRKQKLFKLMKQASEHETDSQRRRRKRHARRSRGLV